MHAARVLLPLLLYFGPGVMGTPAHAEERKEEPVQLRVERAEGQILLIVIGEARETTKLRYELSVDGASKVRNASTATLTANAPPVVLSKVAIDDYRPWSARLLVTLSDGQNYTLATDSSAAEQIRPPG